MKHIKFILLLLVLNVFFSLVACAADNNNQEQVETENSTKSIIVETGQTTKTEKDTENKSTSQDLDALVEENVSDGPETTIIDSNSDEPASPVNTIKLSQAEQGISNRQAERFFKTFSTIPVCYSYKTTTYPENKVCEVKLAIDDNDQTYKKISMNEIEVEILSTINGQYFELDAVEEAANEISQEEAQGDIISRNTFERIYNLANVLYYVGEGQAKFLDQEAYFEEYTRDNETFIRYYFTDDHVLGHRSFKDNNLLSEVEIKTLKNYFEDELYIFEIPEGYSINYLADSQE